MDFQRGEILLTDIPEWNIPHKKYAVVIGENEETLICLCLINSKPSPILAKKKFQIKLLCVNYNFLTHDSFIDCGQVFKITKAKINDAFDGRKVIVCGKLNKIDMESVLNAGKSEKNIILSPKIKKFFQS
jgi:hypothetical protein